jgi:hypothetical protein
VLSCVFACGSEESCCSVREEITALDDGVVDLLTRHCPALSSLELDYSPAITDVGNDAQDLRSVC